MVTPFYFKTVLLAKHAQHVVLIHFPIGLLLVRWCSMSSGYGRSAVVLHTRHTTTYWRRRFCCT
jgi:hypothetical protein